MRYQLKASTKLYLLVTVLSCFMIGIGAYGIYEMRTMNKNTQTLYADRIFPMDELGDVRFYYASILSTAQESNNKQHDYSFALRKIKEAEDSIQTNWNAYLNTYLTREEDQLAQQTALLINESDISIKKLKTILTNKNALALDSLLKTDLPSKIIPTTNKLTQLLNLQIKISRELYQHNNKRYDASLFNFFITILISLLILIPFSYFLVRNIKDLIKNLRESNEKIHAKDELFRSLVNHAAEAIFMIKDDGTIFDLNQSAVEMLMYSREELIGATVLNFHPVESRSELPGLWEKLRQKKTLIDERLLLRKDGSTVEVEISRRMLPDASGAIAIVRDITERKKGENKLKEQNKQLMEIAFLQSHMVRRPVASILGLISLLKIETPNEPLNFEIIPKLAIASKELDEIIFQIVKKTSEIES